jgi:hypothetical protein
MKERRTLREAARRVERIARWALKAEKRLVRRAEKETRKFNAELIRSRNARAIARSTSDNHFGKGAHAGAGHSGAGRSGTARNSSPPRLLGRANGAGVSKHPHRRRNYTAGYAQKRNYGHNHSLRSGGVPGFHKTWKEHAAAMGKNMARGRAYKGQTSKTQAELDIDLDEYMAQLTLPTEA